MKHTNNYTFSIKTFNKIFREKYFSLPFFLFYMIWTIIASTNFATGEMMHIIFGILIMVTSIYITIIKPLQEYHKIKGIYKKYNDLKDIEMKIDVSDDIFTFEMDDNIEILEKENISYISILDSFIIINFVKEDIDNNTKKIITMPILKSSFLNNEMSKSFYFYYHGLKTGKKNLEKKQNKKITN